MTTSVEAALALSKENKLVLEYKGRRLSSEEVVPRQDAADPPTLKWAGTEPGPFVAVGIDLDAPYASAAFLSPLLHWIQADLSPTTGGELQSQTQVLASWVQPAPPPYSGPHRYLILLYKQPLAFNTDAGKSVALLKRIRWSVDDFVEQSGIHELVAAQYFKSN